jgi:basic membrane protein A
MRPTFRRSSRIVVVLATTAAVAVALSACAGQAPATHPSASSSAKSINIGLFVSDSFGDHSFFDAAAAGIPALEKQYGATVTKYEGKVDLQSYPQTLQDAADKNQLVFVLGNQAVPAEQQVAAQNPNTTFVFVNGVVADKNIVSASFKSQEGCYMGGVAAGMISKAKAKNTIGFIAGFTVPPTQDCEAGYKQGALSVDPTLKEISQVVGSFSDPNKGLAVAQAEAQQGAYVIYAIAGLSGQGVVKAAQTGTDIAPITADGAPDAVVPAVVQDQTAVLLLAITKQYEAGTLKKGSVQLFGFKEGAYTVSYNSKFLSSSEQNTLKAIQAKLVSGAIVADTAAH